MTARTVFAFILLALFGLAGCVSQPKTVRALAAPDGDLDGWMKRQEEKSWQLLQENISPDAPKNPGDSAPARGVVVAAQSRAKPDYYFHWVRDSAHVMNILVEADQQNRPYSDHGRLALQFADFLVFTRRIQKTPSTHGLGEPRFTVTGEADTLPWSRPQFDGPALRALTVLRFLDIMQNRRGARDPKLLTIAREVLQTDLDFVARNTAARGFDVWEEMKADNYHARLVQLAALEKGADWFYRNGFTPALVSHYQKTAERLAQKLDDHWDEKRGILRAQLSFEGTDGYTAKKTDMDSAVIVAVIEAERDKPSHSVLDDRVQSTVTELEKYFRQSYPINARNDLGLGYGRYPGDIYFGGNPWFFVTADFAVFYFRLARLLERGESIKVTPRNLEFWRTVLAENPDPSKDIAAGMVLEPKTAIHKHAVANLAAKGEAILRRLQVHTPEDGQLYEQFDKETGEPASSRGIGWSHASLLNAMFERMKLREMLK